MSIKRSTQGYILLTGGLLSMLGGYLAEGPTIDTSLIFYMTSMIFLLFGVRFVVFGMLEKRQKRDEKNRDLATLHVMKQRQGS